MSTTELRAHTIVNHHATVLAGETLEAFRCQLHGELLTPVSAGYDEARAVWNGMINRHPALIVRCAHVDDVIHAVNFAREQRLLTAVRGGGHNVTGNAVCDGGLVIDLSPMKDIHVDPAARTARAGGGVTWGELDRQTQVHGLATPGGVVSTTGIAGLTLGGGLGWLRRKYGLSCDNLLSVELVTADGRLLTASATENPELFWAVRGGGGNFGVVTSFEYRLHPVGSELMFCFVLYPAAIAREVLRAYRAFAASAPDEISSFAILGTVPAAPDFPEAIHGEPYLLLAACHAGSVDEGQRALQPLRELGTPLVDLSGPTAYTEIQSVLDGDYPAGELNYYWKSLYLRDLDDAAIDRLMELAAARPSPLSTVDIWQLGGAMGRVAPGDTAVGGREAPFLLGVEANWEDPGENAANIAWTRRVCAEMVGFSSGESYLNFQEPGDEFVRSAHRAHYQRLAELKKRHDPDNLFRLNPNIQPGE